MTEAAAGAQQPSQQFKMLKTYVKDVSYESPRATDYFTQQLQWQPEINVQLGSESNNIRDNLYETVLSMTITVKQKEDIVYLIEIKQAGLFVIEGFEDQVRGNLLGSY